jgi:hypothetical protein
MKDLLDDDAFDPRKLFDKEQYVTLVINREGFSKKENRAADLIESLLDPNITRQESEVVFATLKEADARDVLIGSIRQAKQEREKAILVAACWETGLDFTPHFAFFAGLAADKSYAVAMEALTVVQNCENVPLLSIEEALARAAKAGIEAGPLTGELVAHLKERLKDQ